jgi:thioredoxin-like negative regulator of GroEL
MIVELYESDFDTQGRIPKASGTGGLVIFKADWCGHCRRTMPELERVSKKTGRAFPIFKVDSDKSPGLMNRFKINGFPTIYWVDAQGKLQAQYSGERSEKEFLKSLCDTVRKCY